MTQFRARLRKQGVDYVVVKNTLAQRALTALDLPDIAGFFTGPTGVVIGREDAVAAAKVLTDFAREFGDRPAVKVGIVERRPVDPAQVKRLADCRRARCCWPRSPAGCRRPWRAWPAG
jgi:large subunit ribosomal protein L10